MAAEAEVRVVETNPGMVVLEAVLTAAQDSLKAIMALQTLAEAAVELALETVQLVVPVVLES